MRTTYRSNGSDGKARSITRGLTEDCSRCGKVSLPRRKRRDLCLCDDFAVVEERECFQDRAAAPSHIDWQPSHKLGFVLVGRVSGQQVNCKQDVSAQSMTLQVQQSSVERRDVGQ
jgi:hypothetical protein